MRRRLLQMFGDVVLGIPHEDFEHHLSAMKKARGVQYDVQLTAEDLKQLVVQYKVGVLFACAFCMCASCLCAFWITNCMVLRPTIRRSVFNRTCYLFCVAADAATVRTSRHVPGCTAHLALDLSLDVAFVMHQSGRVHLPIP